MKLHKFIIKGLQGNHFRLGCFVLLNLMFWGINFIIPYLTGRYIDNIVYQPNLKFIYSFIKIFVLINIIALISSYFMNLLNSKINTKMSYRICYEMFEHLKKIAVSYFKEIDTIYLVSKINEDANTIVAFFLNNCVSIITNSATLLLALYILYHINHFLCFILLAFIPLYILIYLIFRKRVYNANYRFKEAQNIYFSRMTEQFSVIKYLKLNSLFSFFSIRLNNAFTLLFKELIHNFNASYLFNNFNLIASLLINIILLFYSGLKIVEGSMTIGMYTIISTYFNMIVSSIHYYMNLGGSYQQTLVSFNRLKDLQYEKEEHNGSEIIKNIDTIRVKNFTFSYDDRILFSDITMTYRKGMIYCIRGDNGAGKTTFVNALLGLYQDIYQGKIYYNETDMADINMYDLRKHHVAILEQEPQLLNLSIYENLTYENNINDKKIEEIQIWLKRLNIYEKINSLPDGLNTIITSQILSGGEKQKLALIRTIIKNCPVLILDEPTSALDQISTEHLIEILEELKADKIILIITHNSDLIDIADKVIEL